MDGVPLHANLQVYQYLIRSVRKVIRRSEFDIDNVKV